MPYIKKSERALFDRAIAPLLSDITLATTAGELNYVFTTILHKAFVPEIHGYARYNELMGVLECVKMELYRRRIALYENIKISENGDV